MFKKHFFNFKFLLIAFLLAAMTISVGYVMRKQIITEQIASLSENKLSAASKDESSALIKQQISNSYGQIPLNFEPNIGQTDGQVKFLARGDGYGLFLTRNEAVLSLEKRGADENKMQRSVVKMKAVGAISSPRAVGLEETEGKSNYFIGNRSENWKTGVSNFRKVKYESVYSGVDLVYYGNNQQLEYDFVVAPNADAKQIKLNFDGVETARIENETGDLLLETEAGTLRQRKPIVYQEMNGERREIAANYAFTKNKQSSSKNYTINFEIGKYDRSKELIIDPILAYGSYLGGNAFDEGRAVAVDSQGNAYVVGTAASRDFPTTSGTIKPILLSRADAPDSFSYDAFVTKINPTGTAIVFSTYFGGRNNNESGSGVAVDANGNVLISGTTMSNDFPTVNAYQATFGGTDDAFAAKLNSTGSQIIYSTYLGGNNTDLGGKIAINKTTGDAVFAGTSSSPNFPTSAGAYNQKLCDTPQTCSGIFYSGSYAVKLTANGNAVYSTLFPAAINDVAIDANDNAVFGGSAGTNFPTTSGAFQTVSSGGIEGFVAKLNPNGSTLVYGTFLGGGLQSDVVKSIALDASQNIYVTGQTQNTAFPTTTGAFDQTYNGAEDAFVTKLNASGSALVYSTFLGGAGKDQPFGIALGTDDSAFVVGETTGAASFPMINSLNGNAGSIFMTRLNATGSALVFSTLLGQGGGYDVATDSSNNAYVTGSTTSGIIVTPNAFQTIKGGGISDKDGYIIKIAPTDENQTFYSISGSVTDQNNGYNNDYTPIVVTVTGTINRSVNLPYNGGQFNFGVLPAGGNYTITVSKIGYVADPQNATFNNLRANQFADFTILRNQAPEGTIVSPSHGTTFNAPATINIAATASDADGDVITKVDFVAYGDGGTINIGTDTTAPYTATWTNVSAGTWALYAFPTDAKGLRGVSTEVVHLFVVDTTGLSVSITNPVENQSFVAGEYVNLSANVSSSVSVLEFYNQNNELIGRRTGAPWTTTWRVFDTGNYTITAKAYNSQGQFINSSPVSINVNPMNHRITGRIINRITNTGIGGITLNLTSLSNPNINKTTTTDTSGNYLFIDLGATPNDSVKITPVSSEYTFEPAVINIAYLGYIDWEYQTFTTAPVSNVSVDLTSPQTNQIFNAPATINLAADASTSNGTISKVEFLYTNGDGQRILLASDATAPYNFQWTNVAAGNYYLIAKATDSNGMTSEDSTFVNVSAQPATIRINGQVRDANGNGMQGVTVNLSGSQTQSFTTISGGYFAFGNLTIGGNYTVTPTRPNTNFTPANRTFTNLTTDALDADFVADTVNQAPTVQINSPANGATYSMSNAIPFNVTANDADGQVVHLTVTAQNNFQSFTVGQSNNGTFNAPWQPTQAGNYTIYAQARDNGGLLTTTQTSITVTAPAPISVSGRIVDRNSDGIEGVRLTLKDYPQGSNVIGSTVTDANGNYSISNVPTLANYVLETEKLNYTFAPRQRILSNVTANQTAQDFTGTLALQPSDFDGDARSDIAVWRPSTGVWHIIGSSNNAYKGVQFGSEGYGDIAVPGNYDGDQKIDAAVYRNGNWYVLNSSNNQVRGVQFGVATDKPVAGDYDGDGKTDLAVFRPSNGIWYILRSSDNNVSGIQWGSANDVPLVGDFDGDGLSDVSVYRPSNGTWFIRRSSDGSLQSAQFGTSEDVPLIGDFDGDKKSDITVFRPSNGVWYSLRSSDNSFNYFQFGSAGDLPVPGDYDLDGKTDYAVFRKSIGTWYIFKSSTNSYIGQQFGADGDVPVPAVSRR